MKVTPDGTKFLTKEDIMSTMRIGDKKALELFHNNEFPAIKFVRSWLVEVNAFKKYVSERHVLTNKVY